MYSETKTRSLSMTACVLTRTSSHPSNNINNKTREGPFTEEGRAIIEAPSVSSASRSTDKARVSTNSNNSSNNNNNTMTSKNRARKAKRGEGTRTTELKMAKNIIHTTGTGMSEISSMIISKDSKTNSERQLRSRGKGPHKDSTRKMTFLTTGNQHSISKTGMPVE